MFDIAVTMGNSKSSADGEKPEHSEKKMQYVAESSVTPVFLDRLFEKLAPPYGDADTFITLDAFKDHFMIPETIFAEIWFRNIVGNDEFMTKDQFISSCGAILMASCQMSQFTYYFQLFSSNKDTMTKHDISWMLHVCYGITLSVAVMPGTLTKRDNFLFSAVVDSVFSQYPGRETEGITEAMMSEWMYQHAPYLCRNLHTWMRGILMDKHLSYVGDSEPQQIESSIVNTSKLWLLSTSLPECYVPKMSQTSAAHLSPLEHLDTLSFLGFPCWSMLYNSNDHGMSMNRFSHHITSYTGHTLLFVVFDQVTCFCIGADTEWREGYERFGHYNTTVIQLSPIYRVVTSGSGLLFWNQKSKYIPQGIEVGTDHKSALLFIDAEFHTVKYNGASFPLHKIEVWGCGGVSALDTQFKQKQWEMKEVLKSKQRKLRLDAGSSGWDSNPDKEILDLAGITTEHAQR